MSMADTAEVRFWAKVNKTDSCWLWTACTNGVGYGLLAVDRHGHKVLAHRFAYELLVGPISAGLHLDHLCRVTLCVNPAHLEAVPPRINYLRGTSPTARQAAQTHCVRGHPFDEANTYRRDGHRSCRTCHRDYERERYRRKAGL